MTTCDRRLGDRTGLLCILAANHEHGHVFVSGYGSEVDDKHQDGGHG